MRTFSRRQVLAGAAGAGVTGVIASTAGVGRGFATPGRAVPTTREEHRVVVIGSGFGGGVTALRLTRAGVPVVLLERGRRWPTGPNSTTFPSATHPDKRILWHQSTPQVFGRPLSVEPYVGLFESIAGQNMTPMVAAGWGGGSLVYQGMTLQPSEEVFGAHFPAGLDWPSMNGTYYPRVARMLGAQVAPDALIRTPNYRVVREFAAHVRRAGLPVQKIPMPIDWNYALAEVAGKMRPSYTNGDGAIGVNNGGKHGVDVTYLAQAEQTGLLDARILHDVTEIHREPAGRWRVTANRTDETGRVLETVILSTPTLFLAAGSMNTSRMLVRAGATGAITDLPDAVGTGWGTNADRIYIWNAPTADFGAAQGGPVVYGSLNWSDPQHAFTVIQASIPPIPVNTHSTMMVAYGVSAGRGHFTYDAATDQAVLQWPHEGDSILQNRYITPAVNRIAGPDSTLIDTNAVLPSTWHPLGGASMGTVCDLEGRVHGQRGLYVVDGALMPGTCAACNPSMTIAAVAERALDRIVATDVGSLI
ncbi:GMC oxidoreductase [Gordonia polyisoprenivorans]|uniref:GMC oxidoreductase n=1 Tax=Gordonia polyisoprenivorans TaxID=84595 RepID=UPI000B99DF46|nr:GMC oxidoreductase [Gordonia polyisoprenivorans]OZC31857.1 cholesterol oxidase [Gordonia polyisoprenivorans]UZF55225.1 NAD(P)-binding protein [Gordonia polyisoprenivorans]WCB36397.1 GMC oxidoreductase [Gordonia polyisoprenivorans]